MNTVFTREKVIFVPIMTKFAMIIAIDVLLSCFAGLMPFNLLLGYDLPDRHMSPFLHLLTAFQSYNFVHVKTIRGSIRN